MKTTYQIAKALRHKIGAHYRLIGQSGLTHDEYLQARSASDQAESTARYLMQYLPTEKAAVIQSITGVRP